MAPTATAIRGLTIFRRSADTPSRGVLYEPALCVIAQGAKRLMFGGREITYRLLVGPDGPRLRQIVSGVDQGQRVTHVLRWLKTHFSEPLEIDRLATQAGMSTSAFHRHFKAVTGWSPLQYQKTLRLQEARRLMLGEALDAAQASFRVGYESPSQFCREYHRHFGAPPRRDIETLRQIPTPAPVVHIERAKQKRRLNRLAEPQLLAALAES